VLQLEGISWQITRLIETQAGVQLTACRGLRVATVLVPEPEPGETAQAWAERVEELLAASAYDPSEDPIPEIQHPPKL
jgi:hypothetical protein